MKTDSVFCEEYTNESLLSLVTWPIRHTVPRDVVDLHVLINLCFCGRIAFGLCTFVSFACNLVRVHHYEPLGTQVSVSYYPYS